DMVEQLGRLKKPSAKKFKKDRKLFFVPLIIQPFEKDKEFTELFEKYWKQAQDHVNALEEKLGNVKRIYHELITHSGKIGISSIKKMNAGSHEVVSNSLEKGAIIQPIEDDNTLLEFMDWSRCMSIGLQSQKVFSQVYESFMEIQKKRNEIIANNIDKTLKNNQIGLLLMREGHQIQFPQDIQVFYVAPPSLDELRRWAQNKNDIIQKEFQGEKETEDK
ncbi:MAG: hypothetical protein JSV74_04045, partial [Dehalococcoidia bacterium]